MKERFKVLVVDHKNWAPIGWRYVLPEYIKLMHEGFAIEYPYIWNRLTKKYATKHNKFLQPRH